LIDWHATSIAKDMVNNLGDWLRHRLKRGIQDQGSAAQEVLDQCELDVSELWKQWLDQCTAQLSIRAHMKDLATVLTLQTKLDGSERAFQGVQAIIEKGAASEGALNTLASLEHGHGQLLHKVDTLYSSLNIQDRFPELDGVSLEFVQTLFLAQDLKINIHKWAIGSFFEWDKLDHAVGSKQKALGNFLLKLQYWSS
ncbi:hypothetical protein PISMIDRAFT_122803, partial [Pisolithus microcarpus 441]